MSRQEYFGCEIMYLVSILFFTYQFEITMEGTCYTENVTAKVILHGGLGNQLFQWAYGHQFTFHGREIQFVFFKKPYVIEHTSTSLSGFMLTCSHGTFTESKLPNSRIARIFLDPTNRKNLFRKFPKFLNDTISDPFLNLNPGTVLDSRYYFGYYQNWSLVERVGKILKAELWEALELRERTPLEMELEHVEVIHIRQGDTTTAKNLQTIGVLNSNYYGNLPAKKTAHRIVLTDDVEGASRVLSGIQVDAIFGPADLDVYQTLGVMARASVLFTANSTLSWWGGFLANSRGADVYIPMPFFRDLSPRPELAFAYPGFKHLNSRFIDSKEGL